MSDFKCGQKTIANYKPDDRGGSSDDNCGIVARECLCGATKHIKNHALFGAQDIKEKVSEAMVGFLIDFVLSVLIRD